MKSTPPKKSNSKRVTNSKPSTSEIKMDSKKKHTKAEMQRFVTSMNKKFGMNAVRLGFDHLPDVEEPFDRIPTGIVPLDIALGGGVPVGRYSQISGAFSTSKSTIACHIVREAQKLGHICSYHDVEGTTDLAYMKSLGVDTDSLYYSKPDGLEECTQLILDMQRSKIVTLSIFDSIEASAPTKELDSDMDESMQMGMKPKLLGEFFRKLQAGNNRLSREGDTEFTLIALNQLREKIGGYGDPEYTPGGRAKDFTASVDIRLRRGDWIVEGTGDNRETVGHVVKFKIPKNKTYKRMQSGEADFYFSEDNSANIDAGHFDNFKSIVLEAVSWGLIERGGAWFYLDKEADLKFQGAQSLIDYLRENPEIVDKLKLDIIELAAKVVD